MIYCDRNREKEYFRFYTLLFVLAALAVFSWYFLAGRTLIWQGDGWSQHYKALVYYAKYMRDIARNFLSGHGLVIPHWDMNIGEGSDIIGTLHYYVIGDPFAVFAVFVPVKYMHLYYNAMILLRLYLSGVAFSLLCFRTGLESRFGVMAGTLSYVFCYWAIFNAGRHPYFLNPMLYLPLLILGVEKIRKGGRAYGYIMSVCIAAVSNFYFFYMLAWVTALYVLARLVITYRKDIRSGLRFLGKLAGASIWGVCMGAVIFLPVCAIFLDDSRFGVGNAVHLFYPLSHYSKLPSLFLAGNDSYWMCMGYAAPALLAVFLLFSPWRKAHGQAVVDKAGDATYVLLRVLFLMGCVIMLFPVCGQILNGFSYMSNRWCWAFALLVAYILAAMWPSLMELGETQGRFLLLCSAYYFVLCLLLEYSRNIKTYAAFAIAMLFLFLIFPFRSNAWGGVNRKGKQKIALLLVFLSALFTGFWKNAAGGDNYASEGMEAARVQRELTRNETVAVKKAAEADGINSFYRYSGRGLTENANILARLSSTQYYWSLSNPYVSQLRTQMEVREPNLFHFQGYDDRAALLALSGVRYYVVPSWDNSNIPYGFTHVDTVNVREGLTQEMLERLKEELGTQELTKAQAGMVRNATQAVYHVYRSENALPLTYAYSSCLKEKDWKELDAVGKQEAMLQGVHLTGYEGELERTSLQTDRKEMEYTLSCQGEQVTRQGDSFVVTGKNASVTLEWEGIPDCETYFSMEGISYQGVAEYALYFGEDSVDPLRLYNQTGWELLPFKDKEAKRKSRLFWAEPTQVDLALKTSSGISKNLAYCTPEHSFYSGRHNFTVNLGYREEAVSSLTVTFPEIGIYSFDSMKVYCQPMGKVGQRIQALGKDTLQGLAIGVNTVSGRIFLTERKALCFSIPYSAGWKAYVDGEETVLYRANLMYMALDLPAGEHMVSLVYQTPLLKVASCISVAAFALFVGIIVYKERR